MRTTLALTMLLAARPPPTSDVQQAVDQEVATLAALPGAHLAVVVVLDPSGQVVALGGQRGQQVDRTLPSQLRQDPGSVMKTFTLGAALEAGLVTPTSRVSGEGGRWTFGHRTVTDGSPHGELSLEDVLVFSSNIGTAKVFARLGHARLEATLKDLGLPTPPMADDEAALGVSYGADVSPTPLEVARAYAAIASGRAFPVHGPELLRLLQRTVDRDDGTGRGARISGVAVAGKTGTSSLGQGQGGYGDFVGIFPAGAPRFVVLVGVQTSASGYAGGSVAAPAFARLGKQLLRVGQSGAP
jgi:cell division protein FtsI (penicillin-binding protein 3)